MPVSLSLSTPWRRRRATATDQAQQHSPFIAPTATSPSHTHTPHSLLFCQYLPSSSHQHRVQCTGDAGQQPPQQPDEYYCCCYCFWDSIMWKVLRFPWRQVVKPSRWRNIRFFTWYIWYLHWNNYPGTLVGTNCFVLCTSYTHLVYNRMNTIEMPAFRWCSGETSSWL